MRHPENISQLSQLEVDWMGFIFYEKSPRCVGSEHTKANHGSLKRVGVFVNATYQQLTEAAAAHQLDYLQLHGDESPEICQTLREQGFNIIKAFSVIDTADLEKTKEYENRTDFFLFDTKCAGYGGSGKQFDWLILSSYEGKTPFLLSGGIHPESAEAIKNFEHPQFVGIDLNSGFEVEPGLKNIQKLSTFLSKLKYHKNMNRITNLFNTKKSDILSVYFTAGYPQLNDTVSILKELQSKQIDLVEIGIPFSDPMADGPVIQEAANEALRNGMSLAKLFEQLKDIRKEISIPLIFMGYLNPVMQYGFENFCRDCAAIGIDGMIIPDLPFNDYISEYKEIVERYNLKMIMLITPETSEERIRLIDTNTDGFIYMVSSASTTGAQESFDEKKQAYFNRINNMGLKNPRLIGFGISNKATLDAAMENASGAIVGSKFVQLLRECSNPSEAVNKLLDVLKK